jgi:6-pyruvoyltetrahydropterin/6-carboxytetrahydropterin synthase
VIWTIRKIVRFEAAHHLPNHDGKCRRVHGHSWRAALELQGRELQQSGPQTAMVRDYGDLSDAIDPIVEQFLDHHDLNETTGLADPTSEALARWLFDKLEPVFGFDLIAVTVWETCTSECRYARQ